MGDFVCGANEADFHLRGVNFGRDCREPDVVADIRNVVEGDPSPDGKGTLDIVRGIEVGHVFALGSLYSQTLGATYLAADGQSKVLEMGCYGIGVTRILGAAIEQNHDERGIVWPEPLAPFAVAIAPIGYDRSEPVHALADRLHDELTAAGVEVLLDDRGERPGVMFADLELIGIPHRITIGDRGLKDGKVEYQGRRETAATAVPVGEIVAFVRGSTVRDGTDRPQPDDANDRSPPLRSGVAAAARGGALLARAARAHWGAQLEEQLAPSVVAGTRQGAIRRCTGTRRTANSDPTRTRGSPEMSRRIAVTRSSTSASVVSCWPPCTTRPRARGSTRNSCSASCITRADSRSTRSRWRARAATCR